jgi:4-amino-4-deoxy-L-arabinose transferase-like glycosyltransferase
MEKTKETPQKAIIRFLLLIFSWVFMGLSFFKNAKFVFWTSGSTLISNMIVLFSAKALIYDEDET